MWIHIQGVMRACAHVLRMNNCILHILLRVVYDSTLSRNQHGSLSVGLSHEDSSSLTSLSGSEVNGGLGYKCHQNEQKWPPKFRIKEKNSPAQLIDLLRLSWLKRNVKWMKSVRFKTLHPWCNFALHVHSFSVKGFKVRVKKEALSSSSCVDWSACFSSWCHHPVAWEPAHWKDEVWNARMLFSRQGICELRTQCSVHRFKSIHVLPCYSNVQSFRQLAELKHFPSAFSIGYNRSNWTSLKCCSVSHTVPQIKCSDQVSKPIHFSTV